MKTNVKLLAQICEVAGAPGHEQRVRELVLKNLKGIADKIEQDNLGNIYAIKKGKDSSKRVMIAAHMDEIGFMVKHIDNNGFLRFHTLGGFDAKTLTAQRVIVHGKKDIIGVMGSKPIHIMTAEEKTKNVQISHFFIDLGLPYKEVIKLVTVGDVITRDRQLIEMGECVNCKSIDNRVSVYILIETLKLLKDCPYDVYGVFTVQEEVGIRGANVAAHNINPSFGFAIKIMDASTICDYRMVKYQKEIATKFKIKWQPEVLPMGGTDTAGIQRMGKTGAIAGAVSIPTRHLHQVIEMAHKSDIEDAVLLLKHCVENLHKFDWSLK